MKTSSVVVLWLGANTAAREGNDSTVELEQLTAILVGMGAELSMNTVKLTVLPTVAHDVSELSFDAICAETQGSLGRKKITGPCVKLKLGVERPEKLNKIGPAGSLLVIRYVTRKYI